MTIQEAATEIAEKIKYDNNSISLLYAFNTTGKTVLSRELKNSCEDEKVLCYNDFIEDSFTWDDTRFNLIIQNLELLELIEEEGDKRIIDNFQKLTSSKLQPNFKSEERKVSFLYATGDDSANENIKISKSEESIFVWSIFYTQLEYALENLMVEEDNRSIKRFNNLEYVIIDDPVSSIDDTRIIGLAVTLSELIKKYDEGAIKSTNKVKFLITTHHALFYNVLYNEFRKSKKNIKAYILSKTSSNELVLEPQDKKTAFSYHLFLLSEIKKAITNNNIQKYHFNMFRNILEKSSIFLGYDKWSDCLSGHSEFIRKINSYSHDRLSEIENINLSADDKDVFVDEFNKFVKKFNFKI